MARDRARERAQRDGYVGFVSCPHGRGRILKVGLSSRRERVRIDCPVEGCSSPTHETAAAMPRARRRGEHVDAELRDAAVEDSPSSSPDAGSARRRVTTEAILAAVPAEDTQAAEVGTALGYVGHNPAAPLLARIGRSERLKAAIIVTLGRGGKPTLLRRRETPD